MAERLIRTRIGGFPGQQETMRIEPSRSGQKIVEKFENLLGDGLEVRRNGEFGVHMIGALFNYYDAKYQVGLTQDVLALPDGDKTTTADLEQNLQRQQAKQDRYKALLTLPDIFVGKENREFFSDIREVVLEADTKDEDADAVKNVRSYLRVRKVATAYYEDVLPDRVDGERDPIGYFMDVNAIFDRAAAATDDSYSVYNRAFKAVLDYYRAKGRLEEHALRNGAQPIADRDLLAYLEKFKLPEYKLIQTPDAIPLHVRQERFAYIAETIDGEGNQDALYKSIHRNFREDRDQIEAGLLTHIQELTDFPEGVQEFAATVALMKGFKGMFEVKKEDEKPRTSFSKEAVLQNLEHVHQVDWENYIRTSLPPEDAEEALRSVTQDIYEKINRSSRKPSLQTSKI